MRTLTTSFENALKKELGTQSYIIRMEGIKKSDSSLKVFYFSNNFEEVDYTAVSGQLMDCEALKQVVDFYTGSYSFGGTDIEVMHLQDMMNDIIKDYNFRNQKCEIYYWCEGQDKRTNQDMVFSDARLVADSNILDGATDFEIEFKIKTPSAYPVADATLMSSQDTSSGDYGIIRFNSASFLLSLDTGASAATYFITKTFSTNTEYLILVKKIGAIITITVDGIAETITSDALYSIYLNQFGTLRDFVAGYNFNGTLYNAKIWSGGDRNTGTLVLDLVGKDDAPLDLSETHTFTKYVSGAGDITYTDNLQRYSKGIIDNVISNKDIVNFKFINDTRKLQRIFPPVITTEGLAKGQVAQWVYGDHASYNYGTNSASGTNEQRNNLVKGINATQQSGSFRWIVGGNGSDLTVAASGALWIWHDEYKRFMEVTTSYTVGTDAQGNKYVEIAPNAGYIFQVYDYIMPTTVNRSGTPQWESPANAINNNFDISAVAGRAYLDVPTPGGANSSLQIIFSDVPTYATQSKVVAFGVDDTGVDIFDLTGHGATTDVTATGGYATTPIISSDGSLPNTLTFTVGDDGTAEESAYVSNCFMRLEWRVVELKDLYIEVTNSIDTQREIIEDISGEAGLTYIDNTDVTVQTSAPILDKQRPYKDWIKEIADKSRCIAYTNQDNNMTVDAIVLTATSDFEFQVKDIEVGSIQIEETSLSNIVNDITINYYYDNYASANTETDTDSNSDSQAIYGVWEKVIDAGMYKLDAEVADLLDYYVNGTTATFFTQARQRVSFWTKNIRGIIPYDASGNLKTIAELEIGDHFTINAEMDSYIKLDGDTWLNKLFKIDGYAIECGRVWIRGIYIRTLS